MQWCADGFCFAVCNKTSGKLASLHFYTLMGANEPEKFSKTVSKDTHEANVKNKI